MSRFLGKYNFSALQHNGAQDKHLNYEAHLLRKSTALSERIQFPFITTTREERVQKFPVSVRKHSTGSTQSHV